MIVTLYHWSIDLAQKEREEAEEWVQRFSEFLAPQPYDVKCIVQRVDEKLANLLEPALNNEDVIEVADHATVILTMLAKASPDATETISKLVIFCRENNELVVKIRAKASHALWGVAIGVYFAIVNRLEPAVAWHELFHLFGAEDCYDENDPDEDSLPLCGNQNCLMQYAPSVQKVGEPPFLCDLNVRRVLDKIESLKQI